MKACPKLETVGRFELMSESVQDLPLFSWFWLFLARRRSTKKNPDQSLVSLTPLRHLALPFSFHTQHPDCLPWLLVYKCPPLLPDRPITLMAKSDPDSEVCRSNSSGLICLCQLFPAIYCYVLPDFLINCTTTVSPLSCSYASVFL